MEPPVEAGQMTKDLALLMGHWVSFVDVPYIPVGQLLGSTVYSKSLSGIPVGGGPLFWNVRKG